MCLNLGGLSHKACLNILGGRFVDALNPDFCIKGSKPFGGIKHFLGAQTSLCGIQKLHFSEQVEFDILRQQMGILVSMESL